jgi:hypothetical protein
MLRLERGQGGEYITLLFGEEAEGYYRSSIFSVEVIEMK